MNTAKWWPDHGMPLKTEITIIWGDRVQPEQSRMSVTVEGDIRVDPNSNSVRFGGRQVDYLLNLLPLVAERRDAEDGKCVFVVNGEWVANYYGAHVGIIDIDKHYLESRLELRAPYDFG